MAQRRMFSKSITNSSNFLMMPSSSQNLYFHLGMNADDDGFCEHFTIMRMTESKPDDLKILQAKNFIQVFDDKVLIILDWKENNYLRSDRYTASKYLDIYKKELKSISGIPPVNNPATQDRIGKVRLVKDSINKAIIYSCDYFKVTKEQHDNYTKAYSNINIMKEYDKMNAWLMSNPSNRKKNYPKFINNWLSRVIPEKQEVKQVTAISQEEVKKLFGE